MKKPVISALFALALLPALAGCNLVSIPAGPDGTRDESGAVTEGGDMDVFSLKVGDCLNTESMVDPEITDVPVLACDEPHDGEVFHQFDLPAGDFPAEADIEAAVEETCLPEFATFAGIEYAESADLDITWLEPTAEGWSGADDRSVTCIIVDITGNVTGTLAGAAR